MFGQSGWLKVALIVFSVVLSSLTQGFAWEFTIEKLTHTGQYINLSQGQNGFFGPHDVDLSTTGNAANLNFWNGITISSGASSAAAFNIIFLHPEIKVNKAISIKGDVWVGPELPGLLPGAYVPTAVGLATTAWIDIKLPWGNLYYGKKPFGQGCGLQFAGSYRWADMWQFGRTEDFLGLAVPYGPLEFEIGVYPWSMAGDIFAWTGNPFAGEPTGDLFYQDPSDTSGHNDVRLFGSIKYRNAGLEMGTGLIYKRFHVGPESQATRVARQAFPPTDYNQAEGWLYFKYNNGRFFLNAETDWYSLTTRYQRSQDGTFNGLPALWFDGSGRNRFAPLFTEAWRFMAEGGFMAGPAKFSALYSWIPGPDRRHGIWIDREEWVQGPAQTAAAIFRPYATLLNLFYRGGNNSFLDITDAQVIAARLDYAVAANMDVSCSFLKANRLTKGYGRGYVHLDPNGQDIIPEYALNGGWTLTASPNPRAAIPDDDLGYEINLGLRWMILENWMFKCTYSYWQPGNWFKWACNDKSMLGWDATWLITGSYDVNPNRAIDPVQAFRIELWTSL